MTRDQCSIAVLMLNSYAHQFHDLDMGDVAISGFGMKDGSWQLALVFTKLDSNTLCPTYKAALNLIDATFLTQEQQNQ